MTPLRAADRAAVGATSAAGGSPLDRLTDPADADAPVPGAVRPDLAVLPPRGFEAGPVVVLFFVVVVMGGALLRDGARRAASHHPEPRAEPVRGLPGAPPRRPADQCVGAG